jgi:hypothetical protein
MMGRQHRGVTLAEVVLSLGLFVVVILSATQLALVALNSNSKSEESVLADALAQETAEAFIYGLPGSGANFWTTTSFASPYQQDAVTVGAQSYQRVIYVTDYGSVTDGLRSIRVRVSWGNATAGQSKAGQGLQVSEVTRLVSAP